MTALLRHRDRRYGHDAVIDAWCRAVEAVKAAEAKVEEARADYRARLAAAQTERSETIRRRQELLASMTVVVVGDDAETASLLDVPSARSVTPVG